MKKTGSMQPIEPKLYAGIDYEFRPESFRTAASDPLAPFFATSRDEIDDELLGDSLSDETRISLGEIHPTFMGGECLPNYSRQEVEIAHIALASTTSNVISLRARPTGCRIKYRVVDKYQTEFHLPQQTSRRPFSLGQLIRFLDFCGAPGSGRRMEGVWIRPVIQRMQSGLWN